MLWASGRALRYNLCAKEQRRGFTLQSLTLPDKTFTFIGILPNKEVYFVIENTSSDSLQPRQGHEGFSSFLAMPLLSPKKTGAGH
jgi:hypothetical protein